MKAMNVLTLIMSVAFCAGCGPSMPEGVTHLDKYDERLEGRTPAESVDITYKRHSCAFSSSEMLKCHVARGNFVAFAKMKDWELHSDTYSYNSRTKRDEGGDPVSWLVREFDGVTPTNYLSYNYFYTNNGGITVLYDADREIMYYSDSTN